MASGRATGFGPVVPGSNPGAPATVRTVSHANSAAVVMAGGLGTRMRSATPKHFHALLGRHMVDWVIEAARPLALESPLVVVTATASADRYERGHRSGAAAPSRHRRCRASAREALGHRRRARALGRHAAAHVVAPHRSRRGAPGCGRSRNRLDIRTGGLPCLRSSRPRRRGRRASRLWKRRTHRPSSSRAARGELVDLRLPRREPVAGARTAGAGERPGRAVPDRRGARPGRAGRQRVACPRRAATRRRPRA